MLSLPELPKPTKFRLLLRCIAVIVGVFAAFIASVLVQENLYMWAVLPTTILLLAALGEFVLADVLTEKLYPATTAAILSRLEENLRGYHDRIRDSIARAIGSLKGCDRSQISGTFHLKVDVFITLGGVSEPALVQVVDYSGRLGGKRWRFTAITKGLVGRCLRTGKPEAVSFSSEDEYRKRMVTEFGFTKAEVENRTRDARSYWAQPVIAGRDIVGILYLFSTEPQVFPRAINPDVLEGTANEIAAYLEGARIIT